MVPKYTIEFVKIQFHAEDYILLSTEYKNTKTKLSFVCNNGHTCDTTFERWLLGNRCRICAGNVKYTIGYIRKEFESEGYVLLSKTYKNAHTYLRYVCPKGHKHKIKFNKWQQGRRCRTCFGKNRPTLDKVFREFKKEGYELLSTKYKNSATKLKYKCPNGHIHYVSWDNWLQKRRCTYCSGNFRKDIGYIRKQFEKEGYLLLSSSYTPKVKLDYICSNKHTHSIMWGDWQSGYRCPFCAGNVKFTYNEVKKIFNKKGCKLLSKTYTNSLKILYYICNEGHASSTTLASFKKGHGCMICASINRSGKNHHNWKGGISLEPYCDAWGDKKYKQDIKSRDGNTCQNPYCFCNDNRPLHIHHIDYNKQNCHPRNLITVCGGCNSRANSDRDWHKNWYQTIMSNKFGYKY